MRVGILGGGFGLYGWLPAVAASAGAEPLTLSRYRDAVAARDELAGPAAAVTWVETEEELVASADVLVVARRPRDQHALGLALAAQRWPGALVLEKPLAPDPGRARELVTALRDAGIPSIAGYSLLATPWAQQLLAARDDVGSIDVTWRFHAAHWRAGGHDWKGDPGEGGGALRFYGIHLLALFAALADWTGAERLAGADERRAAGFVLTSPGLRVQAAIDNAWPQEPEFALRADGGAALEVTQPSPFGPVPRAGRPDPRIAAQAALVGRALAGDWDEPAATDRVLDLWERLEGD